MTRLRRIRNIIGIFLIAISTSVFSVFVYALYEQTEVPENNGTQIQTQQLNTKIGNESDIYEIIEKINPAVVGVSSIKPDGSSIFSTGSAETWNLGSGIVASPNGYIVTNQHVSGNKGSKVNITFEQGNTYVGDVVWADSVIDVAIVKINASGLTYATLGDSSNIQVGYNVYAIGNPLGFEFQRTVTKGIISAKNRTIKITDGDLSTYMNGLLQTDASINNGNSGGPLINSSGEIIGINTIKVQEAEGIGFAIPINLVKPIINQYLSNGIFNEPYIGIYAHDKEVIPYMDSNKTVKDGIYVAQIDENGPCKESGIKIGDIIIKINGKNINSMIELRQEIYEKQSGDEIILTIERDSKQFETKLKLGEKKV